MNNPRRAWIGGTVVVSLLVCVLGWFFGIAPQRTQAADLDAQTQTLARDNDILESKVATLRAQFARIDDFKAQLAGLQRTLPTDANVTTLLADVEAVVDDARITVKSLEMGEGRVVSAASGDKEKELSSLKDVTAKNGAEADEEAGEGEAAKEDAAPADAKKEPAKAPAKPSTDSDALVSFPLQMTAYGSFEDVTAFVGQLQAELPRFYLVTTIRATGMEAAPETDGTPELKDGDVEYLIAGQVFAYTDRESKLVSDYEAPFELPAASGANPFDRKAVVEDD